MRQNPFLFVIERYAANRIAIQLPTTDFAHPVITNLKWNARQATTSVV